MKSSEIRSAYIDFFKSKGHAPVASSSLVPTNDPTLLFTNAGMNQFKDCFLGGEVRAYKRATTCQKVMRISGKHNDFENVGVTARHHTFFEMLGNFSFGDYFKPDAIKYAWEFVTEVLKIPRSRLWITIYEKDDEAYELWSKNTSVLPGRIIRLGMADNFWQMGETGPCGPCTEIHVYRGEDESLQTEELFRREDGSFLEIWNVVFMQYNRFTDGTLEPLPKPSVDTGMGLERVASVMQQVPSNYDTDLLRGVISLCEELSGFKYDGTSYVPRDLRTDRQYARDVAMRVIADHSRAITFLVCDGVLPASDGRGYVLRRILRRAVRHGRVLEFKEPFLAKTVARVVEMMSGAYPELKERQDSIQRVVDAEERKFHETLDSGLSILQREVEKLGPGEPFPGSTAFLLHDTYGFPLDLTEDALKAYNRKVDVTEFNREMEEQRERSRADRKSQGFVYNTLKITAPKNEFLGYRMLEAESKITQAFPSEAGVSIITHATPFYAESGGQVGDTGTIRVRDVTLRVVDTQKVQDGYHVHECEVAEGQFSTKLVGENAYLQVDPLRRARIRTHHSATHLVHAALRRLLGSHVKQSGSRVDDRSLRFDYSHFEPVPSAKLEEIQALVNEEVRANDDVVTEVMGIEEAQKSGAVALFGEKYGDTVRVVRMGDFSKELCGGTHVARTGDIGIVLIAHEAGIAAGVRRIECLAGAAAEALLVQERKERERIAELLKSDTQLPDKVEKLLSRTKTLERELEAAKGRLASLASEDLLKSARSSRSGVKVIAQRVDVSDPETLRGMVDRLRLSLGSGVVALAGTQGDRALIVAGVTADLTKTIHAGKLVSEVARMSGGKGGGRPDFAQAGGLDASRLAESLEKFFELVG